MKAIVDRSTLRHLLPTLNTAREAANRTKCLANLRQIGMSMRFYAGMNKDQVPFADYNNVRDPDPGATYGHLAQWLDRAGLAYLHLADTNA